MRTWSDASGRHKIEAKLKAVEDGKVKLSPKGGGVMAIALDKLSAEDQAYVAKHKVDVEDDPFKLQAEDDADNADDDKPDSDKPPGGKRKAAPKVTTVTPDWSQAENIPHAATSGTWKLTVASPPEDAARLKGRTIPIPSKVIHDRLTDVVISSSLSHALVGSSNVFGAVAGNNNGHRHTHRHVHRSATTFSSSSGQGTISSTVTEEENSGGGGDGSTTTKLTLCDLAKGKVLGTGTMPGKYIPLAVDDGGTRALVVEDVFGFDPSALELWDLTSTGPKRTVRWWPALMGEKTGKVSWARFSATTAWLR